MSIRRIAFASSICLVCIGFLAVSCKEKEDPEIAVESVSLDKTELSLEVGQTAQLTATVLPENATKKTVSWSSDKPEVATVDALSGNIQAIKPGSATITVRTRSGGKVATCKVTVTAKPIPVSGITLSQTSATLAIGETLTLVATVAPEDATNPAVVWSSSIPDIVSVNENGELTARGKGSAEVTATTVDGGFSASCSVTVFQRRNYKFRVSINGGDFADAASEYTYQMLPPGSVSGVQRFLFYVCEGNNEKSVLDSEASHYDVTIVSQDPEGTVTARVTGQEAYGGTPKYYTPWVYPLKAGTAFVKVSYDDGEGNAISKDIKFTITAKSVKSISLGCNEFALGAGNTRQLSATVVPADASFPTVTWSSSNPGIAKVSDNGLVTAVAKGETYIKAVNEEGVEGKAKIIVWPQPNAVDLGLSVLWADRNLGADSSSPLPIPPYCYFAWSETAPEVLNGKYTYNNTHLTYWDDAKKFTKYCLLSADGVVDNKPRLEAMDDAAHVILGNGWRMPTVSEVRDLLNLSRSQRPETSSATSQTVYSLRFTASNGKYIELPMWAAYGSNTLVVGYLGAYWTSELTGGTSDQADQPQTIYMWNRGEGVNDFSLSINRDYRTSGLCIRPVKSK